MARKTYYIPIGKINYAWTADEEKYKNIASVCGIKTASSSTKDLVFGANKPKPPRVRLNFEDGGTGGNVCRGSQIVFCAIDKLEDVVSGNKLVGKKSNGFKIRSASMIGARS